MRNYNPKLRNMTHALSLRVFIAFKGTKFFIIICLCEEKVSILYDTPISQCFAVNDRAVC